MSNFSAYKKNPLSQTEMTHLTQSYQELLDCYLVASVKSLTNSNIGKNFLRNSIQQDKQNFYVSFPGANNALKKLKRKYTDIPQFKITSHDCKNTSVEREKNILTAIELATCRLRNEKKVSFDNVFSSFARWTTNLSDNFEFGLASKFLHSFTGQKPKSIGDKNIFSFAFVGNYFKRKKAEKHLNLLAQTSHSTVAGSVHFPKNKKILFDHYYIVKQVDSENKTLLVEDPRKNYPFQKHQDITKLSYKEFFKNFRSIVGYVD